MKENRSGEIQWSLGTDNSYLNAAKNKFNPAIPQQVRKLLHLILKILIGKFYNSLPSVLCCLYAAWLAKENRTTFLTNQK